MKLKKILKKQMKRNCDKVEEIYVVFDKEKKIPELIELHYHDKELEDENSLKGSRTLHKLYQFPRDELKFYKPLIANTEKLVLIYNTWTCKWHVNEVSITEEKVRRKF